MATNAKLPPQSSTNGVITAPPKGVVGGNRKKQKRRAKQAAKVAAQDPTGHASAGHLRSEQEDYDEDPLGYADEDDYEYSDAENYHDQYGSPHGDANGYDGPPSATGKKKKKKMSMAHQQAAYNPELLGNSVPSLPTPPPPPTGALQRSHKDDQGNIWNTSTAQERQNIKVFWLALSEEERKSLLKIEKEAVLRKMKQQQKHSCSCTVCGRKRTAIEEELEVLYEGYYEELEQYAHNDHLPLPSTDDMVPDPLHHRGPHPLAAPPPNPHHKTSHLHEHLDDDEFSDDDEYSEDEEYSDDEPLPSTHMHGGVPDFFNFGQNLTVKDNLLTVADDLLKNDGRKFIEMMEQLAERRVQRENEAVYASANPSHPGSYPPGDPGYNHEDPLAAGDEFDDDEASYDSQEEYDDDMDEEDEMGGMTEDQRIQEGKRMFQIFAARMFEQRVLTAYREKVAAERQQKLLEELEDETKLEAQREAKKQRDAQKKKDKKKQQQQAKAEEKAKKEAEKAAEEARLREAEEKKLDEQRRKKEEQRKKKEEERKKLEEERAKKEAEKLRRQQEEQQRREEAERKAREQKAAEKAKKEEARKREREERERKAQEEKEKKERETKAKAEREAKEREKTAQQATQPPAQQQGPQTTKRSSQPGMVAVPGVHPKPTTSSISPHPSIATPAVPKAPTPARQRQASQQGSHASSPKQSLSQVSSAPSKSSSPNSTVATQHQPQQPIGPPKITQKAGNQQIGPFPQHPMQATSPLHQQQIHPPPGMVHQQQHAGAFGGMPTMSFSGFQGPQAPMMHGNMGPRGSVPMYTHQGPAVGVPNQRFAPPTINGLPAPPPGMMAQPGGPMRFPFDNQSIGQPPPGFGQPLAPQQMNQTSPIGQPSAGGLSVSDAPQSVATNHSRQTSASDKERFEFAANQPIARPAPIQPPGSVKLGNDEHKSSSADVDDLSRHLGSSALLDGADEPMPSNLAETRRQSNIQTGVRNPSGAGIGPVGGGFGAPGGAFGVPSGNWNAPTLPFGQGPGLGQQNWGSLPNSGMSGWTNSNAPFTASNSFGTIGSGQLHRPAGVGLPRPLTIRLAVCQACKQLANANRGDGSDGFHDVHVLLRQIDANRPPLDSLPTLREIEEICETEGDGQNGGGLLHVRKTAGPDGFAVKWEADAARDSTDQGGRAGTIHLGEIGSPMPSKSSPVVGFGAPGMGRAPGGGGGGGGGGGFQSFGAAIGSPNL